MATQMTDKQRDIFNKDIDNALEVIAAAMNQLGEANMIIEGSLPDIDHDPSVLYRADYNRGLALIHQVTLKLQNLPRNHS